MVNHMAVNFDAQSSFLRFYQISPPAIIDGANPPDSVQAKLVGGIVVPADQIPLFIAALESGFEKYTEAHGAQKYSSKADSRGREMRNNDRGNHNHS